jgi:hypothetical protein
MQRTIKKNSRYTHYFQDTYRFLNKWWVRYIVGPLVVTLPPAVITVYVGDRILRPQLVAYLPAWFSGFLDRHVLLAYTLAGIWVYAFTAFYAFIESTSNREDQIDVAGLLALSNTIEKVVGAKARRFGAYLEQRLQDPPPPTGAAVFDRITQPRQQMALLAEGLHAFFDVIDKRGAAFRVGIAECRDNKPVGWLYFSPESEPPRTSIEDLQSPHSTISACLREKDLVIVEDIVKEAAKGQQRRYVATRPGAGNDEGSQLCYPVIHHYTRSIPYVIAVAANKKGYFQESQKELYLWILRRFALRFELEHSLLVIKHLEGEPHDRETDT